MHILLYEYTTGGGLIDAADQAELASLLAEGAAMLSAVAADFVAAGHRVQVLRDVRCHRLSLPSCEVLDVAAVGDDVRWLQRLAAEADWTLIIAPETDGILLDRCRQVVAAGGRLLGPSLEFIELASDKHCTAERLRVHGVPAPAGCALAAGECLPAEFEYPAVLKPRDGCGSQGVRYVADCEAAGLLGRVDRASRLERFHPGSPLSVALLCGPDLAYPLPPCRQTLSIDGRFAYLGGSLPVPAELAHRAQALALRAINSMPAARGYIGIDMVLGEDLHEDTVIEINPRLTTSYIGLRAACRDNLAAAMLAVACGQLRRLLFSSIPFSFTSSGEIQQ